MAPEIDKQEAYRQHAQARLEEFEAELAQLKARTEAAAAEKKIDVAEDMEELEQRMDLVRRRVEELQVAGADVWQELRGGLESAWNDLGDSLERIRRKYA
jgi:uncharacterized protein YicC (UPF0701 family)